MATTPPQWELAADVGGFGGELGIPIKLAPAQTGSRLVGSGPTDGYATVFSPLPQQMRPSKPHDARAGRRLRRGIAGVFVAVGSPQRALATPREVNRRFGYLCRVSSEVGGSGAICGRVLGRAKGRLCEWSGVRCDDGAGAAGVERDRTTPGVNRTLRLQRRGRLRHCTAGKAGKRL